MPRVDGPLLRRAINLFAKGKSCADDHIVAEMLTALDEDVIDMMAEAFEKKGSSIKKHPTTAFSSKNAADPGLWNTRRMRAWRGKMVGPNVVKTRCRWKKIW